MYSHLFLKILLSFLIFHVPFKLRSVSFMININENYDDDDDINRVRLFLAVLADYWPCSINAVSLARTVQNCLRNTFRGFVYFRATSAFWTVFVFIRELVSRRPERFQPIASMRRRVSLCLVVHRALVARYLSDDAAVIRGCTRVIHDLRRLAIALRRHRVATSNDSAPS